MEFKFSVNDIFKKPVVEINHSLIPPGFTGDRRSFWDVVGKVSEVVNAMGEASAAAQGLTKPITTAERLRNSEHTIYLLIDNNAGNGRGAVTGMLKTGKKGLYVFDRNGQHYQVSPPCVLDFYIHESRQRTGLGKRLFEHMLQHENIEPVKMAIDRPSDKFLGFLNKHYTLNSPVKQMNNYVVFDGFFPSTPEKNGTVEQTHSGGTPVGKKQSANGLQSTPLGRYGAPRPHCSMGQIIHNQTATIPKNTEPTGVRSAPETNYQTAPQVGPGNPAIVTQSAPNVYYRSPEQPQQYPVSPQMSSEQQYQQNSQVANDNNLKYHQQNPQFDVNYYQRQQQSNNMWQNLGSGAPEANSPVHNKTNFHPTSNNYYQNNQNPYMGTNQTESHSPRTNAITPSNTAVQLQPQNFKGQGQMMYQNVPSGQYSRMAQPNMQQNIPIDQYSGMPQANIQPAGGEMVQTPNVYHAQNMVQQGNAYNATPQVPNMNYSQPTAAELQNAQQFGHVQQPVNYNASTPQMANQQNVSQMANQQNVSQPQAQASYTNQQLIPPQNVIPTSQIAYNAAHTASAQNIQSYQNQPNVTQSMPNTNIPVQYNNQMVSNQPQSVPYNQPNVTHSVPNTQYNTQMSVNSVSQPQNVPYEMMTQPSVTQSMPNTNIPPQYNNQPQNVSYTPNINVVSQYPIQNMTPQPVPPVAQHPQNQAQNLPKTVVQQQNYNESVVLNQQNRTPRSTPSHTNSSNQNNENIQMQQHMEGSQLNSDYNEQEKQAVNATGDTKNAPTDAELMFKYGYPPQVPDVLKRTGRSQMTVPSH